ncbi:MAG: hypothetical protein ACK5JT_11630 [Hyphomicrobiaceae bacterium]
MAQTVPPAAETAPADANAQAPAARIVNRGDAVVTGFAGTLQPGPDLPIEVHPLDRTMIDLDGATVRVFDLTKLGSGPQGQLSDARLKFVLKARDVGHVFGVAFDSVDPVSPPNIYLTATSVFGLQLVAPGANGKMERVLTGRPEAQWMPGLFGHDKGGSPGTIWKVDGRTGIASPFAEIKTGDLENSGAGLGSIAFDPRSRHLYVSDLETGLVWRLDMQGQLLDVYDHGTQGRPAAGQELAAFDPAVRTDRTQETFNTEVPDTWGFAPPERRVFALAIANNRLYYSVAEGPSVWSVGLNEDGSFANDARREITVKGTSTGDQITSILFDGPGIIYLSQRGGQLGSYDYQSFMRPQEAKAMRYRWQEQEQRWSPDYEEYAVGLPANYQGSVGGIALNYGYDRFGSIDYGRCRQTLWITGEHLRAGSDVTRVARGGPENVDGLQGIYKSRVKPQNAPPFESWYVDFDANYSNGEGFGQVGNVGIFSPCQAHVTYSAETVEIPVWTKGPDLTVDKICYPGLVGGRIRCDITVRNKGDAPASGVIKLVDETRILWGTSAQDLVPIAQSQPDGPGWTCAALSSGAFSCQLDPGELVAGASRNLSLWIDTHDLVAAGNLGFRNCVTLDHPHGRGKVCAEGGTDIVVEKSGPSRCAPGEDCAFKIRMINKGTLPFEGDLLLSDHLFLGGASTQASISEIEPPLGCDVAPNKLPFSCLAHVKLAPGEIREHKILVEMPDKSPVWVANCFVATEPWLLSEPLILGNLLKPLKFGVKSNDLPGGHPACVWLKIADKPVAAPKKVAPYIEEIVETWGPRGGFLPPLAVCADGRRPLPNGRCPCPRNAPWDPEIGSCRAPPLCWSRVRLRPDGYCCPRGTVWWPQTGRCRPPPWTGCHNVALRKPDGTCCPRGTRWQHGACRPVDGNRPCKPGFIRIGNGLCVRIPYIPPIIEPPRCPDGSRRLRNGHCPPKVCPRNARFSPRSGRCEPLYGDGQCGPGFVRRRGGHGCEPTGKCPGKFVRNQVGLCVPPKVTDVEGGGIRCPLGQRRIGGRCLPGGVVGPRPLPPPSRDGRVCPKPLVRNAQGRCVAPGSVGGSRGDCPRGQRRVGRGRCVAATPPARNWKPVVSPTAPRRKVEPVRQPPKKIRPTRKKEEKARPKRPAPKRVRRQESERKATRPVRRERKAEPRNRRQRTRRQQPEQKSRTRARPTPKRRERTKARSTQDAQRLGRSRDRQRSRRR